MSYRAALGGLRREKRWEAAVKLISDMDRRGVGPDEVRRLITQCEIECCSWVFVAWGAGVFFVFFVFVFFCARKTCSQAERVTYWRCLCL